MTAPFLRLRTEADNNSSPSFLSAAFPEGIYVTALLLWEHSST